MRNAVFIHTNPKQIVGALVAQHALRRHSAAPERFDVHILQTTDFPVFERFEGRRYLREGQQVVWRNDDLQSFTPLRFAVPQQMGYTGRAVLIDPDIFALADINILLERDMGGAALMARQMDGNFRRPLHYASSVMLMDCARLRHWQWEVDFERVFRGERDYRDWMWLLLEPPGSVAALESEWNDFDRLAPDTKLLHNTHRRTQPWKTGLSSDFTPRGTTLKSRAGIWLRKLTGRGAGRYRRHPDPAQERLFFRLLGECLDNGSIDRALLDAEIAHGHVRADAMDCVARAAHIAA
ncbi:hypothetical protein PY257_07920 [Ramlibacter sp. H39-3-26]|uniref:hypothetical protein n=1 Tax=Curvibacter soli TaxID=3031331 RepID=UPI0023DBDBFD|nr:hypothetical protein [Ramlibacter sp. H39-3-26]MDF1485107.1 hypothetical protein [Ramlibacter sp. H39-3-26]